jgi:hypothetical protein
MRRVLDKQYEYHVYESTKESVKCVVKKSDPPSGQESKSSDSRGKKVEFAFDRPQQQASNDAASQNKAGSVTRSSNRSAAGSEVSLQYQYTGKERAFDRGIAEDRQNAQNTISVVKLSKYFIHLSFTYI